VLIRTHLTQSTAFARLIRVFSDNSRTMTETVPRKCVTGSTIYAGGTHSQAKKPPAVDRFGGLPNSSRGVPDYVVPAVYF
jgi:hypothetical protein